MTIRDGRVVWDLNGLASDEWIEGAAEPRRGNRQ
jgi:hypothetical protein